MNLNKNGHYAHSGNTPSVNMAFVPSWWRCRCRRRSWCASPWRRPVAGRCRTRRPCAARRRCRSCWAAGCEDEPTASLRSSCSDPTAESTETNNTVWQRFLTVLIKWRHITTLNMAETCVQKQTVTVWQRRSLNIASFQIKRNQIYGYTFVELIDFHMLFVVIATIKFL